MPFARASHRLLPVPLLGMGVAAMLLASCSGEPSGPPGAGRHPGVMERADSVGGGGPEGARGNLNLFISPMGEPFHGHRGDPYPVEKWFARADANHDGQLTEEEFLADADLFFATLDTNHDGVIDGFEISDYERLIAPEILPRIRGLEAGEGMDEALSFNEQEGQGRPRGRRGRGGGGERRDQTAPGRELAGDRQSQGAGLFSLLPDPEPVASASSDLNGRVTHADWREAARRRFQRLLPTGKSAKTTLTLADLPKPPVQILLERRQHRKGAVGPEPPR